MRHRWKLQNVKIELTLETFLICTSNEYEAVYIQDAVAVEMFKPASLIHHHQILKQDTKTNDL